MNRWIYRILSGRLGARFEIQTLMRQTAKAFGADTPRTIGRSSSELLRTYAQFTANAACSAIDGGQDLEQLQEKLYHMACRLGNLLYRWLRPKDEQDCLAVIILLYRNIGIEIREGPPGEFTVYKCYFSAFYTPDICSVISAIDQGIFAGVYRKGRLTFSDRITEGYDRCQARLRNGYVSAGKDKHLYENSNCDRLRCRRRHDGQRTAGTFSGNDTRSGK